MTDRKDPAVLARRFIDLWQDQLSAVARDPALGEATARWWRYWLSAGLGASAMPAAAAKPGPGDDDGPTGGATATAAADDDPIGPGPARSQAARAASRDRDADLEQLARRVRELEARLAALEPGEPPGGRAPARRPRRVSSRRRPDQP